MYFHRLGKHGDVGRLGDFGPESGLFHPFSFLFLFTFLISNPNHTMFSFEISNLCTRENKLHMMHNFHLVFI
jgi:hypothetical protein